MTREQEGVFLAVDESTVPRFVGMNDTGGPVDVWEVRGGRPEDLLE
ncbi:MAG: hypothetical protein JWQ53_2748 [Klenkia sp.]|nr:hypothetical protein [Klenkia sp.]